MDARSGDLVEQTLEQDVAAEDTEPEFTFDAPEVDAAEQHAALSTQRSVWAHRVPFDANEADAADQDRIVELDEDDYR